MSVLHSLGGAVCLLMYGFCQSMKCASLLQPTVLTKTLLHCMRLQNFFPLSILLMGIENAS